MKIPFATATGKLAIVPFILLCAASISGPAAQQQKTKILVQYSGTDVLGARFAFALKEDINQSSSYQLDKSGSGLRVLLVSQDVGPSINGRAGDIVAVSMMLVADATSTCSNLLSQGVYVIPSLRINETAQTLLADIDHILSLCGKTPLSACQLGRERIAMHGKAQRGRCASRQSVPTCSVTAS
jgi:hypothetical protein